MVNQTYDKTTAAVERAKQLGTYGKNDRSAQYKAPENAKPEKLLEAVNVQGNHIRGLQSDQGRLQRQLMNLKLRNGVLVSAATAFFIHLPRILSWAAAFFR
jgi:hypothetical protein